MNTAITQTPHLLYVVFSFIFQLILIVHFATRKWAFGKAIQYGWIVYALAIPAFFVSLYILGAGESYGFWLAGILNLAWAIYGWVVEYRLKVDWRIPFRASVGVPYLLLYLATTMFYWFPLRLISEPLFYLYSFLYVVSTVLNVSSHRKPASFPA